MVIVCFLIFTLCNPNKQINDTDTFWWYSGLCKIRCHWLMSTFLKMFFEKNNQKYTLQLCFSTSKTDKISILYLRCSFKSEVPISKVFWYRLTLGCPFATKGYHSILNHYNFQNALEDAIYLVKICWYFPPFLLLQIQSWLKFYLNILCNMENIGIGLLDVCCSLSWVDK